ncbi:MAG: hypothetical protein P4L41_15415 [Flavipsychrobacter sp.]|nr:hypothetical protein [Flavipsychrobacter sp.]
MKKCILFCCSFVLLIAASCSGHKDNDDNGTYAPPPPGHIVAADSVKVKDDPNNFTYKVTVKTGDNTASYGVYDVVAEWGPNTAESQFTMPRGGEKLKPLIKKGTEPYTYIIGFHYGDDKKTFYDYYQVTGTKGMVEAKYIKAYSFK